MICTRCQSEIDRPKNLTDRQRDIVKLMSQGMTNEQIARRIKFSHSTVRQESMSIYKFFGVNDRHSAVMAARMNGYISDNINQHQPPFGETE